jgi:hypothetical protein
MCKSIDWRGEAMRRRQSARHTSTVGTPVCKKKKQQKFVLCARRSARLTAKRDAYQKSNVNDRRLSTTIDKDDKVNGIDLQRACSILRAVLPENRRETIPARNCRFVVVFAVFAIDIINNNHNNREIKHRIKLVLCNENRNELEIAGVE